MGSSTETRNSNDPAQRIFGEELERAMMAALQSFTPSVTSVKGVVTGRTDLQTELMSRDEATSALEIAFHEGVTGSVLILVSTPDLIHLGEVVSGFAANAQEPISPESTESCLHFLKKAFDEWAREFSEGYGKIGRAHV